MTLYCTQKAFFFFSPLFLLINTVLSDGYLSYGKTLLFLPVKQEQHLAFAQNAKTLISDSRIMNTAGVSILQENLNYFPALNIVCQILPPNSSPTAKLQVNQGHRSIFLTFVVVDLVGVPQGQMRTWTHRRGVSEGGVPPSEAGKFCIFETGIW